MPDAAETDVADGVRRAPLGVGHAQVLGLQDLHAERARLLSRGHELPRPRARVDGAEPRLHVDRRLVVAQLARGRRGRLRRQRGLEVRGPPLPVLADLPQDAAADDRARARLHLPLERAHALRVVAPRLVGAHGPRERLARLGLQEAVPLVLRALHLRAEPPEQELAPRALDRLGGDGRDDGPLDARVEARQLGGLALRARERRARREGALARVRRAGLGMLRELHEGAAPEARGVVAVSLLPQADLVAEHGRLHAAAPILDGLELLELLLRGRGAEAPEHGGLGAVRVGAGEVRAEPLERVLLGREDLRDRDAVERGRRVEPRADLHRRAAAVSGLGRLLGDGGAVDAPELVAEPQGAAPVVAPAEEPVLRDLGAVGHRLRDFAEGHREQRPAVDEEHGRPPLQGPLDPLGLAARLAVA
mmetsp:Transcript_3896/g.12796  ORF Transcript_3896/g.12796 Transcript_3896/m.12796 type:complete len:420 (-) Transcript_3896:25-1284(-)